MKNVESTYGEPHVTINVFAAKNEEVESKFYSQWCNDMLCECESGLVRV